MKKNYISLQELNFKNAGLDELSFNEMEMIDGGDFWSALLKVLPSLIFPICKITPVKPPPPLLIVVKIIEI